MSCLHLSLYLATAAAAAHALWAFKGPTYKYGWQKDSQGAWFSWQFHCCLLHRWVNALDPTLDKGPWTHQQDMKLLENVEKFGKGEFTLICKA